MAERSIALVVLVALVSGFVGGLVGGVVAPLLLVGAVAGSGVVEAVAQRSNLDKAKETMADIRTLGTATEAYAVDNARYPTASNVEAVAPLLQPTYVKTAPTEDAWGHLFVYNSEDRKYFITSLGPDDTFDTPDDIIYSNGSFLQYP